jgi:hypothetical protein
MHKSATKCNEIVGKWCKNKHRASKIIDTLETYQRCRRTRQGKRRSISQSYSISAKSMKLPQYSSLSTIFRGGRSSSTTQARWSWKIGVPMGRTLHCDRSNTRRSLSTTRQENGERREQPIECRATTTVLRIGNTRRQRVFRVYDPLNTRT